ncbi:MAG: response regulator transcription factor [Candidatus Contendobacter sp.]|nr:response regulator transcription factor [Candidatus Contendobacter sp.]
MATILLLEDDEILRGELALFLVDLGYRVLEAGTLADFAPLLSAADLAIIDVMLPDGDGFDATARLRACRPAAGAIILTARSTLRDKVRGLSGGADHYMVKPVSLDELAAVVAALLRRVAPGWRLDLKDRRLISPEGHAMALSPMEMTLFELLSSNPGETVSRQALVAAWGYHWLDYDVRRLEQLVSRLRRRWEAETGQPLPLKTVHRFGYSFSADLNRA